LRGATRSAGSGRMNTAEINDVWSSNIDARLLTEADLCADSFEPQARRYNRIPNSAGATCRAEIK
jgi:hypothetical protein